MASARNGSCTSTGDLKNNLVKLLREVHRMKLQIEPNIKGLTQGIPSAFLPILHSALMNYSLSLAQHIAGQGIEIYSKTDLRFTEGLYKVMRDIFNYRPKLTREQFLSEGFAEHKVIQTFDVLRLCQQTHKKLKPPSSTTTTKKYQHRSKISVHTLADTAGIGRFWQEKPPKSTHTNTAHNFHHVPIASSSPPLSTVSYPSPLTICGPLIDPHLDITPLSTPLKCVPSSQTVVDKHTLINNDTNSIQTTNPISENFNNLKDLNINEDHNPILSSCDSNKIASTQVNEENDHIPTVPVIDGISSDDSSVTSQQSFEIHQNIQEVDTDYLNVHEQLTSIANKMNQLVTLVETLSGRLTLLETQVKLNEAETEASVTSKPVRDAQTQTTTTTTPPRSCQTPPTKPRHVQILTPYNSSTLLIPTTPTTEYHMKNTTSINSSGDCTVGRGYDTQTVIDNLRTRAQRTKELLHRTNHS